MELKDETDMEATPDEFMVVCMARQVRDGEVVAQGIATPLVAAAYLLARYTHAPNLYFASAIGQGVCREPAPLSLTRIESLWLDRALNNIGFVQVAADVLPRLRPKEFFRPAQVDPYGNFNNIAFGKNYVESVERRPRLRLPGSGGIPDVTTFIDDIHLYVPRHSRLTFVRELDVRSGLGYDSARKHGSGPRYLISDLGQFDFENGRLRLVSYHANSSPEQIQSHTGFELEISPNLHQTPAPSIEELKLLRQEIDPLGIRRLESLSGAERRDLMHAIIAIETAQIVGI
jgi:acyl CoA:acetate/3-ketoacid CoA transferase beta subunit